MAIAKASHSHQYIKYEFINLFFVKGKSMTKSKPEDQNDSQCSRREFIKNTMTGLGTIAIGSSTISLIEGCASSDSKMYGTFGRVKFQRNGSAITVNISMTENRALTTVGETLVLGGNDVDKKGILLYRESTTTVKAYSRECTHQQCTVGPFINGVSSCPCHGSRFDLTGEKISGPASRALDQYTTSVDGNIITIKAE
jgi:cytochrome b6-f complex iron-sulfur subunit